MTFTITVPLHAFSTYGALRSIVSRIKLRNVYRGRHWSVNPVRIFVTLPPFCTESKGIRILRNFKTTWLMTQRHIPKDSVFKITAVRNSNPLAFVNKNLLWTRMSCDIYTCLKKKLCAMCVTLFIFMNSVSCPNNFNMNNFPNLVVTLFLTKAVLRRIYYGAKETVVIVQKY